MATRNYTQQEKEELRKDFEAKRDIARAEIDTLKMKLNKTENAARKNLKKRSQN